MDGPFWCLWHPIISKSFDMWMSAQEAAVHRQEPQETDDRMEEVPGSNGLTVALWSEQTMSMIMFPPLQIRDASLCRTFNKLYHVGMGRPSFLQQKPTRYPTSQDEICYITKASEASWSYSCDSKVSFDRVQILTPDFSGRRPPPPPPHPPPEK